MNEVPPRILTLNQVSEDHGGTWQMAVDEALLQTTQLPILRMYRWLHRTISFGYFMEPPDVAEAGECECVRRWTGGGVVDHQGDLPYSVIIPASHPLAQKRPMESYHWIHAALVESLAKSGIATMLVDEEMGAGIHCFEHPVVPDVLLQGKKIAGAGQRRSRWGMLHQGAIQGIPWSADGSTGISVATFLHDFAQALGCDPVAGSLSAEVQALADRIEVEKYGSEKWKARR